MEMQRAAKLELERAARLAKGASTKKETELTPKTHVPILETGADDDVVERGSTSAYEKSRTDSHSAFEVVPLDDSEVEIREKDQEDLEGNGENIVI